MKHRRYTRGKGFLEPYLANLRAKQANSLIPDNLRRGRILDIGCGTYPYFLSHTYFEEKFAIENLPNYEKVSGINFFSLDLNNTSSLPFHNEYFTAISMLAVIEHLNPNNLVLLMKECYRILSPGGILILTTPSPWSDGLLKMMAKLSLVSKEEIQEHVFPYTLPIIGWYFGKAGFLMNKLKFGYFEIMLNMWALAQK